MTTTSPLLTIFDGTALCAIFISAAAKAATNARACAGGCWVSVSLIKTLPISSLCSSEGHGTVTIYNPRPDIPLPKLPGTLPSPVTAYPASSSVFLIIPDKVSVSGDGATLTTQTGWGEAPVKNVLNLSIWAWFIVLSFVFASSSATLALAAFVACLVLPA